MSQSKDIEYFHFSIGIYTMHRRNIKKKIILIKILFLKYILSWPTLNEFRSKLPKTKLICVCHYSMINRILKVPLKHLYINCKL